MTGPERPKVADVDGHLKCTHTGTVALTGHGDPGKLTVGGSAVVRVDKVPTSAKYDGCTVKDSNGNPQPCDSTTVTGTAKLTVGGQPVLLTNATLALVNPITGPGTGSVDPGQTKLTAS
jgi:hypothetical protein